MMTAALVGATLYVVVAIVVGVCCLRGGHDQNDDYEVLAWERTNGMTGPRDLLSHRRI